LKFQPDTIIRRSDRQWSGGGGCGVGLMDWSRVGRRLWHGRCLSGTTARKCRSE